MLFPIDSIALYTDEDLEEIFEVVVLGVTFEETPNPHGYDLIVQDVNSSRRWQVSPDELEVA